MRYARRYEFELRPYPVAGRVIYFAWYDVALHSYPNGYEWLLYHHRQLWRDIQTIIDVRGML